MKTMLRRWAIGAFALMIAVAFVGTVSAQMMGSHAGVGNDPPPGPFLSDNGMINVMTPDGGPIPITIDPNSPAWIKRFVIQPGPVPLVFGAIIPVWEKLLILPPQPGTNVPRLPFTDWHEQIIEVTQNLPFGWVPGGHLTIHNPNTPDGLPPLVEVPGMVDPLDPRSIWFGPWPGQNIPPNGLPVWIHKELRYLGEQPITFPVEIFVREWPTVPEPTTVVLAGLCGLALVGVRRRRRSS